MASPELRLLGPEPEINSGLSPSFYAFSEAETQHPPHPPPPPPPSRAITVRSTRVISLKYEGSGETSLPLRDLSKIGECTRSHSFVSISIYLGIGIAVRKIATDARSLSDRKKKEREEKRRKKRKSRPFMHSGAVAIGFLTVCCSMQRRARSRRAREEGDFIEMDWTPRRSLRHEG